MSIAQNTNKKERNKRTKKLSNYLSGTFKSDFVSLHGYKLAIISVDCNRLLGGKRAVQYLNHLRKDSVNA